MSDKELTVRATQWYEKAIRFCLYSLVVLMPAAFLPQLQNVFSMPKLLILRTITAVMLLLWGCKSFVEEKFTYRKSIFNIFVIIYGLISIINTAFSSVFFTSIYGRQDNYIGIFTVLNFLILALIAFNFLKEIVHHKKIILVSFYTSSVLAIYGLIQFFGIGQKAFNWSQNPSDRVFGTLGHANHFGAYLAINIALGSFVYFVLKQNKQRWLAAVGLILQIIVLFLTGSRGAFIALILAFMLQVIFVARRHDFQVRHFFKKSWKYLMFAIVVFVVTAGALYPSIKNSNLIERTENTVNLIQNGQIPDRLSWWLSSLEMIKSKPLLGFGLSTFRDNFNYFRRTDYLVPGPGDLQDMITPEAAHNEYLDIAVTQGLIGLASFLLMIGFVIFKMIKSLLKKISDQDIVGLLLFGGLIAYLLQLFFNFQVVATATIFYLFLGAAAAICLNYKATEINLKGTAKYTSVAILFIAITLSTLLSLHEVRAEYYYKQAQIAAAAGDLNRAITYYQKTVLEKPYEYSYHQAFADFALKSSGIKNISENVQRNFLSLAVVNYRKAMNINPNHPSISYNLGLANMQLYLKTKEEGYFLNAQTNFIAAIGLSTNNPLYPYQVGKAYLQAGTDAAKQLVIEAFKKALEIRNPYKDTAEILKNL